MLPTLLLRCCAIALVSLTFVPPIAAQKPADAPDGYEGALARYRECMQRLPFRFHTEGRTNLATTRMPEALQILCADYEKPKYYAEYTRYVLARLFEQNFANAQFVPTLDALRKAHSEPADTWLWVHTLRIQADHVGDTEAVAIATTSKNVLHRAAAITALGLSRNGNIKSPIVTNCLEWPKKDADRCLLLGAMSGAFWENRRRVNDAEYREALTAYIGLLAEDVDLTHQLKIQIARHLQKILKGPALFVNPEPWLELLLHGDVKVKADTTTSVPQRFFGVETQGERFCYVLDMSDSMLQKIEQSAKPPTAVLTGPRKKPGKKAILDESDLPWDKIITRWDLAREQMRISLTRLDDNKYFSIVWFGTESGTLDSCKGMIKATKGNVMRVMAELDDMKIGPKDEVKAPHGQLKGTTNMHSGLRRAFSLSDKGYVEEAAFVDTAVLTHGCDTIFLLSDGAPSWDDFHIVDKDYGEGKVVVDTEYGAAAARTPQIRYHGPYDQDEWLVEDVRRMNAFRRIHLHCIGLGEANMGLLGRLAEMGRGEVFQFGKQKDAAKK